MWGPGTSQLNTDDPDRIIEITRDLIDSFLDVHVRNGQPETFTSAVDRYPEVSPAAPH